MLGTLEIKTKTFTEIESGKCYIFADAMYGQTLQDNSTLFVSAEALIYLV